MILSASRRTDIPNYYSDWFYNRIKEGFAYVRNPINPQQVSKINLSPEVVDCIVFWTKNPEPMLERLDELAEYKYYFQFTLTGYGKDIECNVPHKKEKMIPIFQKLSKKIGSKKVIWRYDPIIFTETYTPQYHLKAFEQIAEALSGYTQKCIISFVDIYEKNRMNLQAMKAYELSKDSIIEFAGGLNEIAAAHGMRTCSCGEEMDLSQCGIQHNSCVDKELIEELTRCRIRAGKDKNQRMECGCVESVEIGAYNTCKNACKYCYANFSQESVMKSCSYYDVDSPLLCGRLSKEDKISERKVRSFKDYYYSQEIG